MNAAPEFLGFILIGVGGAFVAVLYMRAILYSGRIARKLPVADFLKPALAGAALGLAAIWVPDILGIGKETLRFAVIDQAFAPGELAFLLIAKILATALCIGFGFAGGCSVPHCSSAFYSERWPATERTCCWAICVRISPSMRFAAWSR